MPQAVSRTNILRLLKGNFTLKLNRLPQSSLLDGGSRSSMANPGNTRLPIVDTAGPLNHIGHLGVNFLVRLRYHTTRANGCSAVISGGKVETLVFLLVDSLRKKRKEASLPVEPSLRPVT